MTAFERLNHLYEAESAAAEAAADRATVTMSEAETLATGWPRARQQMLPTVLARIRQWRMELRHMHADVGLHRHSLAYLWLRVRWKKVIWRSPLPIWITLRIVGMVLAVVALTIVLALLRTYRWVWRNRQVIALVIVSLVGIAAVTYAISWSIVNLPDLFRSMMGALR